MTLARLARRAAPLLVLAAFALVVACGARRGGRRAGRTIHLRPVQHPALDLRLDGEGVTYTGGQLVVHLAVENRGPATYTIDATKLALSGWVGNEASLDPTDPEQAVPASAVLTPGTITTIALTWSMVLRQRGLDPRRAMRDETLLLHLNAALRDESGQPLAEQFPVLHFSYEDLSRNPAIARVPRMVTSEIGRGFDWTIGTSVYPCSFRYVQDPPVASFEQVCPAEAPHLAAFRAADRDVADTCLEGFAGQAFADDCGTLAPRQDPADGSWITMACCRRREYTHPGTLR